MRIVVAAFLTLALTTAAFAGGDHSSLVALWLPADDGSVARLVGRGIDTGTHRSVSSPEKDGASIVWRQVREATDPRGGRHQFLRQFVEVDGQEVELAGSEVGIHSDASGKPRAILGRQFERVTVGNKTAIRASDVAIAARRAVAGKPNFRAAAPLAHDTKHDTLKLVPRDGHFRYTWFTLLPDDDGLTHHVTFDAETNELLAADPDALFSNCAPTTPAQSVVAIVDPVRPDVANRSGSRANIAQRPDGFVREAYSSLAPAVTVYQQTKDADFMCSIAPNDPDPTSYTMVPLALDGTSTVYRDVTVGGNTWYGSAAGDAIHHVRLTNAAFNALGRNGWNGTGGALTVVLQSTHQSPSYDRAYFRMNESGDTVPAGPILGINRVQNYYSPAASLDHIAHEMGHGVIFTTANFPCLGASGDAKVIGCQLHEGFADVIGHIVEKKMQPAGTGVEQSSDWLLHEDGGKNEPDGSSGYARGAYDDGPGHTWTGPWGYVSALINDVVHKDDDDSITDAHVRGGMLSVVLRLMSEGGMNDICARRTLEGCTSPMPGIGLSKAGPIMFDAIQYYMPSSASWADLPTYVSQAAFDLYETCSVEPIGGWAPTEQTAVLRASYAIGYYRQTPATRCP